MVRQIVSLQPMEVNGGAVIQMQDMEDPMLEQVNKPEGGCDPMATPHRSRFLAGFADLWREETSLEQVHWQYL
ncbi:hypothetical protein llap_4046 [Limosa lapponica baueri]|uniref:Uncharacterized protein n=1 Tax=Limosa lapponica baueri TaxID=1758121 RepID=A0A2I0UHZ7_LIMLA|nr:hypothetical protein llap_4046 [Limosa lapponica baueri]